MNHRWPALTAALLLAMSQIALAQPGSSRVQFREPRAKGYLLDETPAALLKAKQRPQWLRARPENDPEAAVDISSRLVVQLADERDLSRLIQDAPLTVSRRIADATFILQAPDAATAIVEAQRLAGLPEVTASAPIMRRNQSLHAAYAPAPNDPYFTNQWHLEYRNAMGAPLGVDVNARSAWPVTRGAGVTIGFGDDGVELTHPDLASRQNASFHYNFSTGTTNGGPATSSDIHATPVAGLAVAEQNNQVGVSGVAPEARFASWKIFNGATMAASDEQLGDLFQFANDAVAVQNHSWGFNSTTLNEPSLPEKLAIQNAVENGRGGRGDVIVRSTPEPRSSCGNSSDDA